MTSKPRESTRNPWHHRLGLLYVFPLWNRRITHILPVLNPTLQRTAPRVTLAATHRPAAFAHPAPAAFPQPARRAPQSLSLGSLGHSAHPTL